MKSRSLQYRLATIILMMGCAVVAPAKAANPDVQNYRRAFSLIDSGHVTEAEIFTRGHDPILNKVIRSLYMAQPGNDVSFEEMAAFIVNNPDWPYLRGVIAIAEQKLPASYSNQQIIDWFTAHPPVSAVGFYRYIDALNLSGQTQNVGNLIHNRWVDGEFGADELAAFYTRYPQIVGEDEIWARFDRLLWKEDVAGARHLYPYLDANYKALAEARLGLALKASNVETLVEHVPSGLQNDPGLLYEKLRWFVHNNQDDQALSILNHAPDDLVKPEAWWEQRQIMARRLMDRRDYEGAYRLAANHGHLDAKHITDAEFLCGWLALRFLNDPDDALQHFQALYDNATTPVSHARGAYWLGRTYEVRGDQASARQSYETAAALNITYYGQLAAARIDADPVIQVSPEPSLPASTRTTFYNHDLVRAAEHLDQIGERDRAHAFFHAVLETAKQRVDFALMTELAYRMNRPDLAIEAGKAASQKNMLMTAGGFPLLGHTIPKSPDPAFVHALIRQESMFNPDARSPVGAEGLMQLMPGTAKGEAKKLGIRFKAGMLNDPDYNVKLGAAFVQEQLDGFDGSYILALAGYNAGPHRVREWMADIGDPRRADVDVVDWVEEIPIYETRNYVQRIMEALQIYRARLAGGQATLQLEKDLRR